MPGGLHPVNDLGSARRMLRQSFYRLTAVLGPRMRLLLVLIACGLRGRAHENWLRECARSMMRAGSPRTAWRVWRFLANRSPGDAGRLARLVDDCLVCNDPDMAMGLLAASRQRVRLATGDALRVCARLVAAGRVSAAAEIFSATAGEDGDVVRQLPSPIFDLLPPPDAVNELFQQAASNGDPEAASGLCIAIARYCFSAGEFDAVPMLYAAVDEALLEVRDRVAMAYANAVRGVVRDSGLEAADVMAEIEGLPWAADWQFLLAMILFLEGRHDEARNCFEKNLRARFQGIDDLDAVVRDCLAMLDAIRTMPAEFPCRFESGNRGSSADRIPKVFVCGFGWSGSGAVHDALREYDCFCEFPATPCGDDKFLNSDIETEVTFVQASGGLGRLYRKVRASGSLRRGEMLELFRCHVVGGACFGYVEYKSAKVAANLLSSFGHGYTRPFAQLFERVLDIAGGGDVALGPCLREATEALCALPQVRSGKPIVLLNNAIFGRNIDMLELFDNARAVVVYRDPRDMYADRKRHDLKHWRSVPQFVEFVNRDLERFISLRKQVNGRRPDSVRAVSFERFIGDGEFRSAILEWVMGEVSCTRTAQRFFPEQSSRNVGIHEGVLSRQELDQFGSGEAYRRLRGRLESP